MPASKPKALNADVVVTYPSDEGWKVLELTTAQAEWLKNALVFTLPEAQPSSGREFDYSK